MFQAASKASSSGRTAAVVVPLAVTAAGVCGCADSAPPASDGSSSVAETSPPSRTPNDMSFYRSAVRGASIPPVGGQHEPALRERGGRIEVLAPVQCTLRHVVRAVGAPDASFDV